ncbi:MAG TPA: hypothetical protein VLA52_04515 [Thermohalobaculum sp.]|nr:hypothetical protein [Thermohalobaculum sp.]
MNRQADEARARPSGQRKIRDQALILPLVGFALLMPPFARVFDLDLKIAGVPFTLIYLFTVWAVLILCGWRLSRRLDPAPAPDPNDERPA